MSYLSINSKPARSIYWGSKKARLYLGDKLIIGSSAPILLNNDGVISVSCVAKQPPSYALNNGTITIT